MLVLLPGIARSAFAQGDRLPVPWPLGSILEEAIELAEREQYEEFLEAREIGEQSEHIRIYQNDIDNGRWNQEQLFIAGDGFFEHMFHPRDGYGDAEGVAKIRDRSGGSR